MANQSLIELMCFDESEIGITQRKNEQLFNANNPLLSYVSQEEFSSFASSNIRQRNVSNEITIRNGSNYIYDYANTNQAIIKKRKQIQNYILFKDKSNLPEFEKDHFELFDKYQQLYNRQRNKPRTIFVKQTIFLKDYIQRNFVDYWNQQVSFIQLPQEYRIKPTSGEIQSKVKRIQEKDLSIENNPKVHFYNDHAYYENHENVKIVNEPAIFNNIQPEPQIINNLEEIDQPKMDLFKESSMELDSPDSILTIKSDNVQLEDMDNIKTDNVNDDINDDTEDESVDEYVEENDDDNDDVPADYNVRNGNENLQDLFNCLEQKCKELFSPTTSESNKKIKKLLTTNLTMEQLKQRPSLLYYYIWIICYEDKMYQQTIDLCKSVTFPNEMHRSMQSIWDYTHEQIELNKKKKCQLTSVQRFRLKQRNEYPLTIWNGQRIKYGMDVGDKEYLIWFYNNVTKNPTSQQKKELGEKTNTSAQHVATFFKNRRSRSGDTRKLQKKQRKN